MRSALFGSNKLKNVNSWILHLTSQRPIAYNPDLTRLSGSTDAGLLMSQLLYWYGKGMDKVSFYKTREELEIETGLTRSQQATAIKKWEKLGLLRVRLKGIPPRRHFMINIAGLLVEMGYDSADSEKVAEMAREFAENGNLSCGI